MEKENKINYEKDNYYVKKFPWQSNPLIKGSVECWDLTLMPNIYQSFKYVGKDKTLKTIDCLLRWVNSGYSHTFSLDRKRLLIHIFLKEKKDKVKTTANISNLLDIAFNLNKEDSEEYKLKERLRYIPLRVRFDVFKRDNFTCRKCNAKGQRVGGKSLLSVDHVIPVFYGGSNKIDNLQTLCLKCNISKRTKLD